MVIFLWWSCYKPCNSNVAILCYFGQCMYYALDSCFFKFYQMTMFFLSTFPTLKIITDKYAFPIYLFIL